MNSARQVDEMVLQWQSQGRAKDKIVWETAKACVGWPYVFGAWGAYCTTAERKKRYRDAHPTIKSACQILRDSNPKSSCTGCKWYPNGERVRCYDCRGFTDWCLLKVGIDLLGEGATAQWNSSKNWTSKGPISTMPKNTLCCLFVQKGTKMSHTGFGFNNETVECSAGVQYFTKRNSKWTHWAIPSGLYNEIPSQEPVTPTPAPTPEPTPTINYPTIRKGSSGTYVKKAQELLMKKGYSLAPYGADGKFGNKTLAATKQFQRDKGLVVDGVIGKKTWAALLS